MQPLIPFALELTSRIIAYDKSGIGRVSLYWSAWVEWDSLAIDCTAVCGLAS